MKNRMKIISLVVLLLVGFYLFNTGVSAELTVGDITLDPKEPSPLSTLTFTVDISGDSISEVRLLVQECNGNTGICYLWQNVSMADKGSDSYETDVTLKHEDATYITYKLEIKSDGTWEKPDGTKLNLTLNPGNNNNTPNDDNETPGFELISFLVAIIVGAIILRKRD